MCTTDFLNEKAGPASDIMIDAADVFTEQTEAYKLCPNEDKEKRKKGEYTLGGPNGAIDKTQYHEQASETDAARCNQHS